MSFFFENENEFFFENENEFFLRMRMSFFFENENGLLLEFSVCDQVVWLYCFWHV